MSKEISNTIFALESFVNTLEVIQDCLERDYPEAYEDLSEIISDEEFSLKQEIQQYNELLLQQSYNLNRDENYINSIWYKVDIKIDLLRRYLNLI